jgi:hypothetical protein
MTDISGQRPDEIMILKKGGMELYVSLLPSLGVCCMSSVNFSLLLIFTFYAIFKHFLTRFDQTDEMPDRKST